MNKAEFVEEVANKISLIEKIKQDTSRGEAKDL